MPKLTEKEKELFEWFEKECEIVCQPDYNIIPAYVSMIQVHDKLVELGIIKDNLCFRCDWQKKHQRQINAILNRVAKKYGLVADDYGIFIELPPKSGL